MKKEEIALNLLTIYSNLKEFSYEIEIKLKEDAAYTGEPKEYIDQQLNEILKSIENLSN